MKVPCHWLNGFLDLTPGIDPWHPITSLLGGSLTTTFCSLLNRLSNFSNCSAPVTAFRLRYNDSSPLENHHCARCRFWTSTCFSPGFWWCAAKTFFWKFGHGFPGFPTFARDQEWQRPGRWWSNFCANSARYWFDPQAFNITRPLAVRR